MKGVGEPCAGEPHARFDGRGLETERYASPRQPPTQPRSAQVLELGNDIGVVGGRPLRITSRAWPVGDETIAFTADFPRSAISAWQMGST